MKIEQIYTGCLAQGAYYITSNGEAAIIDPLRETSPYIDRLKKDGVELKYIFETHFHADFVSGHLDLSQKTGAQIVYGPTAQTAFSCITATDGQEFSVGNIKIKVLHTPGHTMESSTFLLLDETGKEYCIFSGDTLFLGDVGRPDLAQKATDLTQEELAGMLYDSLMNKIMPLPDNVIVYPAHGAGSACGKNMSKETEDTLGNQKKTNYALNQPSKDAFVKAVTEGLTPPPGYFSYNVVMNKSGIESFEQIKGKAMIALSPDEFEITAEETGALILDTRTNKDIYRGFIPQSINIGLDGDFAPWVGTMIGDVSQPILIVSDLGKEEECITRLSRVGFDNIKGYLNGGFNAWLTSGKTADVTDRISPAEFAGLFNKETDQIIDIRNTTEYSAEHVAGAINKPLSLINEWIKEINPNQHYYIYCAGGYRSMIASSILQARGYRNFTDISGGFKEISKTSVILSKLVSSPKTINEYH